jgi:hypothetical protein
MFQTHSLKDLKGFKIRATDGDIGKVDDFYFDDDEWTVRYLVVDTGGWLAGRKVLLSPESLSDLDLLEQVFAVNLTRQQVQDSPEITTDRPVSRQQEESLRSYYGWPAYWGGLGSQMGMTDVPLPPAGQPVPVTGTENKDFETGDESRDPHLRSYDTVTGYRIHADDGDVGKVSDFIVEDEKWTVLYMIVDTGNLFPGKKVLVAPSWIDRISWEEKRVDVDLNVETVKNSPKYDPNVPLTQDYEQGLYRHYNKPYKDSSQ